MSETATVSWLEVARSVPDRERPVLVCGLPGRPKEIVVAYLEVGGGWRMDGSDIPVDGEPMYWAMLPVVPSILRVTRQELERQRDIIVRALGETP